MGGWTDNPCVASLEYKAYEREMYAREQKHHNLKEAHDALDFISMLGDREVRLKRTPKTYTVSVLMYGHWVSFRGTSLCHALKGVLKKIDKVKD